MRLGSGAYGAVGLDQVRLGAVERLLERRAGSVADLQAALARGQVGAGDVERLARKMLEELRAVGPRPAVVVDRVLQSEAPEFLDRPWVPELGKRLGMRMLHQVNALTGAYPLWATEVVRALGPDRDGRHVYDLAGGTGGFARWLARHPPEDRRLRLTSSDLNASYVAIGERAARRDGLDLAFEVRDATDLGDVRGVDLFTQTQGAHHLGPVLLLRLVAEAIRAAPRGILVIDLFRSISVALRAAMLAASPFALLTPDAVQSVRRGFHAAELVLIARLAGAGHVEVHPVGSLHLALHARR